MVRSPPPIVSKCIRRRYRVLIRFIFIVFAVFTVGVFGTAELSVVLHATFVAKNERLFARVSIRGRLVIQRLLAVGTVVFFFDAILRRALRPKRVAPVRSDQVRAAHGGGACGASTIRRHDFAIMGLVWLFMTSFVSWFLL
jgi:hypothetical protein